MRLFEKYKLDLMLLHEQNIRIDWIDPAKKTRNVIPRSAN